MNSKWIFYISGILILGGCEPQKDCVEGNCQDGEGKYVYSDGIIYEGSFKNGKRDGKGKIYSSQGTYYTGEWKNNQPHGHGLKYWGEDCPEREGDRYDGSWKNGKMDGVGIYYYKDGTKVIDFWIDGVRQSDDILPNDSPPTKE